LNLSSSESSFHLFPNTSFSASGGGLRHVPAEATSSRSKKEFLEMPQTQHGTALFDFYNPMEEVSNWRQIAQSKHVF
jgi:hypothetical protein